MTEKYRGQYRDNQGSVDIIIENNFDTLVTEIDGIVFSGSDFNDLCIDNKSRYTDKQLARFTFLRTPIYQTHQISESLCNCSFEISVPQNIIDKLTNIQVYTYLKIEISLGNSRNEMPGAGIEAESVTLSLTITGEIFSGTSDCFELSFDQIRDQIKDKYQLKNCYGCMYGDYSVYGQGSFGTMLCFRNQKAAYNNVTTKSEYMELGPPDRRVQEIFCCDQYENRKNGAGYRG